MFKKGLLTLVSFLALFIVKVEAADIKGYVHSEKGPASNYQIEFYSDSKTFKTKTDTSGFYKFPADSFQRGETLTVIAKNSLDTKYGKTKHIVKGSGNYVLEFYAAEKGKPNFTPNIRWVNDTSNVDALFYGIFWSKKNPDNPCSAAVDTSALPPYYNWIVNIKDSSLQHGDSAFVSLKKTFGDTLWRTLIGLEIDTSAFNAMLVLSKGNDGIQHIYFPLEKIVDSIGVEEKSKKHKKLVLQNPCFHELRISGCKEINLYNGSGSFLGKRTVKNGRIDLRDLTSGIYFIKTEDETGKFVKLKR